MKDIKILVCGMPRSMTTWAFNVLRELLSGHEIQCLWIAPQSPEEQQFVLAKGIILAKCHHFNHEIAEAADIVVYSYRDLRTAAVSSYRKFNLAYNHGVIHSWVLAESSWRQRADIELRYEVLASNPVNGIELLRDLLKEKTAGIALLTCDNEQIARRVDEAFTVNKKVEIMYDPVTMIWPNHRTFQPDPQQLNDEEKEIYHHVEIEFRDWLDERGYIESSCHGQETDYELASIILSALDKPTVIDVGAERGSFIDRALTTGCKSIIAFEPLPRHFQHLKARYKDESRVTLSPLAISDTTGEASFHVALDSEGHELDYYHSLNQIEDTPAAIRSKSVIKVRIASLSDLVARGDIPRSIDFLKIDTDGHGLAVLKGLGDIVPSVIMAEYWDTLPNTSGSCPYQLSDIVAWGNMQGFSRYLVVRRHGDLETIHLNAPWIIPGDWGNVLLISNQLDCSKFWQKIEDLQRKLHVEVLRNHSVIIKELGEKEAEILHLSSALKETDYLYQKIVKAVDVKDLHDQLNAKEAVIQNLLNVVDREKRERKKIVAEMNDMELQLKRKNQELELEKNDYIQLSMEQKIIINQSKERVERLNTQLSELEMRESINELLSNKELVTQLTKGLEEKEAVIQELKKALDAFRSRYLFLTSLVMPHKLVYHLGRSAREKVIKKYLRPKLGILNQHPPREISPKIFRKVKLATDALPCISIVTPSYCQAKFLERTIKSVLDQNYSQLEYVIQDGGSSDDSCAIINRYADKLIHWESVPDNGQAHAINLGFAKTTGEIMAWLNSDDMLMPGALCHIANYFATHSDVDVVYGHRLLIDDNGKLIGRWVLPDHSDEVLSWADFIPQETLFWRRRIWDRVGGMLDESYQFAMDWDLLLRFRDARAKFARIPEFLGAFRVHESQKTSSVINEIGQKEMNMLRFRSLGRIPSSSEIKRNLLLYLLYHKFHDLKVSLQKKL